MRDPRSLFFATASLLLAGCGPANPEVASPPGGTTAPTVSAAPSATASAAAPTAGPSASGKGLDAFDNDPALVAIARAAVPCFREAACTPRDTWYAPFNLGKQVDVKTLVNLLEDPLPEVRTMAAGVLRGKKGQPGLSTDKGLATRVLDALEREPDEQTAREIAVAAGFIDAKATGLQDRVLKLLQSEPRDRVRAELVGTVTHGNWDNPAIVDAVKKLIDDPSVRVRGEAIRSLGVSELKDQACPFWLAGVDHKDASTAGDCMFQLVYRGCKGSYEGLMDALARRAPQTPENLQSLCTDAGVPDSVKKKLVASTDRWAKDASLTPTTRVQALRVLGACDPALGKKTAAALLKDADEYVRSKAAEVQKGAP